MNAERARPAWLEKLETALPVFGHRNWIVVADRAYPAHASSGIETVLAARQHVEVLRAVLKRIDAPQAEAKLRTALNPRRESTNE